MEIAWGKPRWDVKRANSLGGAPQEDDPGWGVKRANDLGGAPLEGARPERRTSVERV